MARLQYFTAVSRKRMTICSKYVSQPSRSSSQQPPNHASDRVRRDTVRGVADPVADPSLRGLLFLGRRKTHPGQQRLVGDTVEGNAKGGSTPGGQRWLNLGGDAVNAPRQCSNCPVQGLPARWCRGRWRLVTCPAGQDRERRWLPMSSRRKYLLGDENRSRANDPSDEAGEQPLRQAAFSAACAGSHSSNRCVPSSFMPSLLVTTPALDLPTLNAGTILRKLAHHPQLRDLGAVGAAPEPAQNDGMAETTRTPGPVKTTRWTQARLNWLEGFLHRIQPEEATPEHLATGWRGELAAYFHLRRRGYTIVAQGWRSHITPGDLDLVGWEGNRLCFVEVKTRTTRNSATAESAVDDDKRRTVRRLARRYLRRAGLPEAASRFDVVTVYLEQGQEPEIALVRDAFGWK